MTSQPTSADSEDPATQQRNPNEGFAADVRAGLTAEPKELSAKYLYDAKGVELFDAITSLDEYYPTRTEMTIFDASLGAIADAVGPGCMVVEPGSGNGEKTHRLLNALHEPVAYVPIEISADYLTASVPGLREAFPGIEILPVHGDFTKLGKLPTSAAPASRSLLFFPGSTIGNFHPKAAQEFLTHVRGLLGPDGCVLIGVDLKKDKAVLEAAYDDAQGVTAAFNLNLIDRMNRELEGNLNREQFRHEAFFDEEKSRIEMRLVSKVDQVATVAGIEVRFAEGEFLMTEVSHKYTRESFGELLAPTGWTEKAFYTDENKRFSILLLA